MALRNFFAKHAWGKFSMRTKLILSLSAIAAVLLISSLISVMEYRSMSSYVSDTIADNIYSINVAQKLADQSNEYNLALLAVVGDESSVSLPDFDRSAFTSRCDSLRASLSSIGMMPLADSVEYSYSAYMLTSLELEDVIQSDFIDTRSWYFERLQPRFNRLRSDIDNLTAAVYDELAENSKTFESTFYRSIIPGIVAVGVGLLLILMLLFFINIYYVRPIYKMLDGLSIYRNTGAQYNFDFTGDDELHQLNSSIREVTVENRQLRRRISALRGKNTQAQ